VKNYISPKETVVVVAAAVDTAAQYTSNSETENYQLVVELFLE